jgi:type IV pilus assembly protein PilY1
MWHFSDPTLGYSAVDPVIVRINGQKGGAGPGNTDADPTKNGRWFAVFASGPTGPIETTTHQFYGRSDQNMKIFVVDLKTGVLAKTFDSLIPNSFAGSLANNAIDFDKGNKNSSSFYTTDVVYIGYVKPRVVSGVTTWTSGGLMRLVTYGDTDPTKWTLSKVIDNTGPVTAAIDKMTDDMDSLSNKSVQWLYFGTGRYFFKNSAAGIDSASDQMTLFGIKDPCYNSSSLYPKQIDPNCTTKLNDPFGGASTLVNQSSDTTFTALTSGKDGWFINLDSTSADFEAERVITTPEVKTNGLLLFTTFKPTSNICGFGGETFFWLLDYSNGGSPSAGMLKGKVLVQLSTGAIVIVDLSQIINGNYYPPTGGPPIPLGRGNRQIDVGVGKPPGPPPPADSLKKPIKKILQIQEK